MLFAAILPWAAPLTLLYTLVKIKQVGHLGHNCCLARCEQHLWQCRAGVGRADSKKCAPPGAIPLRASVGNFRCIMHSVQFGKLEPSEKSSYLEAWCCSCCLQDCASLLLVYRRPMPRHVSNLGSLNTVLLVQVGSDLLSSSVDAAC